MWSLYFYTTSLDNMITETLYMFHNRDIQVVVVVSFCSVGVPLCICVFSDVSRSFHSVGNVWRRGAMALVYVIWKKCFVLFILSDDG